MSNDDDDDIAVFSLYYPHPDGPFSCAVQRPLPVRMYVYSLLGYLKKYPVIQQIRPHITLYGPTGLSITPIDTLYQRTREWLHDHLDDQGVKIDDIMPLSQAFPLDRDIDSLDMIIVTPEILESLDEVEELAHYGKALRTREASIRVMNGTLPSPSAAIESPDTLKRLFNADFHIGRPHFNFGPPVALFHPALGQLAYRLRHIDDDLPEIRPSHEDLKAAHLFISQSLDSYASEALRGSIVRSYFNRFHTSALWNAVRNQINPHGAFGLSDVPSGIAELKNEMGLGGDALIQACVSYTRWVSDETHEVRQLRKISNCPSVVIGLMGDLLEIGITAYTDGPYMNTVFSSRMRLDYEQNANVRRIARAFKAVDLALTSLDAYYETLKTQPPPKMSIQHLFPSPLPEPSWVGAMPCITFTHRMSSWGKCFTLLNRPEFEVNGLTKEEVDERVANARRSGLYIAKMHKASPPTLNTAGKSDAPEEGGKGSTADLGDTAENVEVLVKFTAAYNADAHKILADAGFAPSLHACVPVCGGVQMVVMDRVKGQMAWSLEREGKLPLTVHEDVRRAIAVLHQHDYVFGDLRLPNIMCVPGDEETGTGRRIGAVLVDFDWAGKAGEGRYPAVLNDDLEIWAPGVERGGIMEKEHDLHALEFLKKQFFLDPVTSSPDASA